MHFPVGSHEKTFLGYHRNEMAGVTNSGRIVRSVSAEKLIMSQKYVIMIATAAIFTYLSRVYRSLCVFSSMDAK